LTAAIVKSAEGPASDLALSPTVHANVLPSGLAAKGNAMGRPGQQSGEVISFGPFTLVAGERLLTKEVFRSRLARALDILIAFAARPNEVIGKKELLAQVWPDVTVGAGGVGKTTVAVAVGMT
jgi:DNA-binding response OmpR family regulator